MDDTACILKVDDFNALTLLCEQIEDLVELGRDALQQDSKTLTLLALLEERAAQQREILQAASGRQA